METWKVLLITTVFVLVFAEEPGSACSGGWKQFSCKCYFFSTDKKSWKDSQAYCKNQGADLVVIKSQDKQEFINKYAVGEFHYWIGMNDQSPGFTWVDGTTLRDEDARWKPGAPDGDRRRNENCVFTGPSEQLWGDTQCYKLHKWICER
ncbi:hypothetical protein GJAV_G00241750 [Gymnothorax javanicus]|nr:hypothetical protein GJAV_G00241750 [Gymnothorax javanicus]